MIALLSGHSLTVADRVQPESMSLALSERASTASMVLDDNQPTVTVGQWVQIESGPGAGIVLRVKSIETQIEKKTRTVQLEHVINTLRDLIMFGEVKSSDISGSSANPTALRTASYILGHQSDWVLGAFDYSVSNPYAFNGEDLFSALETVSGSLEDCVWDYSFDSYPFTLNIRHMSDAVTSEMRMDRNIQTLRRRIDRSNMYTRFYPIGKNNLHITGDYVSRNEALYGTVCKTETDQSLDTEEKLRLWAEERISRHCEPIVNITISGLELADATGEPLDSFTIGTICRVPLPEAGTVISERVKKLDYKNIIDEPMSVTITLANELMDVATILKQQQASGGRGGRATAKNNEEDHAWFVDTTEHVGMVAEAVAGPGADKDWSRVASIYVDGQGIHQRVLYTENEVVKAEARIEVTERGIEQEVIDREATDRALQNGLDTITGSGLWVQRDNITGVTGQFYKDDNGKVHIISGSGLFMDRDGSAFGLYDEGNLTGGIMVTRINGQTNMKLRASTIDIEGVVNALDAYDISCGDLTCGNLSGQAVTAEGAVGGATGWFDDGVYVNDTEMCVQDATVNNGVLTITKTDGTVINFSHATSLSGTWDGNRKFTATAGSLTKYTTIMSAVPQADISWNGFTGTATLKATLDDGEVAYTVGNITVQYTGAGTVALDSDNISSSGAAENGNVYAKYDGVTQDTKSIVLQFGSMSDGSIPCYAYLGSTSGNRISRAWKTFAYMRLVNDHYDSVNNVWWYKSSINKATGNVFW